MADWWKPRRSAAIVQWLCLSRHGRSRQKHLKGPQYMPNDAKIGLICGIGIVVAISIVFFRTEGSGQTFPRDATAAAVGASKIMPAPASPGINRALKTKATVSSNPIVHSPVRNERATPDRLPDLQSPVIRENANGRSSILGEPVSGQEGTSKSVDRQRNTSNNDEHQ